MAKKDSDESTAMLFSGSHHQSFQGAEFRTAGNDIYMPTFNVNFHAHGVAPSPPHPSSATSPPKRKKRLSLSHAVHQVSRFFRSSESSAHQSQSPKSPLTPNSEEMRRTLEAVPTHQGQLESSTSTAAGIQDDSATKSYPSERSSEDFKVVRISILCSTTCLRSPTIERSVPSGRHGPNFDAIPRYIQGGTLHS